MASCESTGRELSSEWTHHRISSIDSEVRVTLQNPLKHSGSETVKTFNEGINNTANTKRGTDGQYKSEEG